MLQKRNILKLSGIISLMLFISLEAFSQVEFSASVNTHTVTVGQSFMATFSLKGGKSEKFEPPSFDGFRVIGQSKQSGGGMTIIVQGRVVSDGGAEESWTYTLNPTNTGTYTIGAAKVRVDGKWYTTKPVTITVKDGGQGQTQQQQQHQPQQRQAQAEQESKIESDEVFIRASVNKSSVYVGEPVIISYKLYTRLPIPQYNIDKIPSFDGFWAEDLYDSSKPGKQSQEIINEQQYTAVEIRHVAIYPQRAGTLALAHLEVEAVVRKHVQGQRRKSAFDDFFDSFFSDPFVFGRYEDIKTRIKSNPLSINVIALPVKNSPASFSGQVGNYTMEAFIDKDRILLNDALNLTVKITGDGNMKLLEAPNIGFPQSFEVFDPQTEDNFRKTIAGIKGTRTFNYVIIPRDPGVFKIQPIEFAFFDLQSKDYKILKSDEFKIDVVGEGGVSRYASAVGELSTDIRFIKINSGRFRAMNTFYFNSPLFYILIALPLLAFIAFVVLLRRQIELQTNKQLLKYKQATKIAKKRLKKAGMFLSEEKINEFYEETSLAIWDYLSDRFGIQKSELSVNSVVTQLSGKGAEEEVLKELEETLNYSEFARFAPGVKHKNPETVLNDAIKIISSLEQHIQKGKR